MGEGDDAFSFLYEIGGDGERCGGDDGAKDAKCKLGEKAGDKPQVAPFTKGKKLKMDGKSAEANEKGAQNCACLRALEHGGGDRSRGHFKRAIDQCFEFCG